MFSAPSCGPTTRSSTNSIGADSAPERSSSASSAAFSGVPMPVIWKRRAQFALDGRRRQHGVLALFLQQHGHALADALAGRFAHLAAAVAVQVEADGRLLVLVEAGGGAGDVVTGQDDVLRDHDRRARTLVNSSEFSGIAAVDSVPGVTVSSTMRNSRVAVRPMMSLAWATSCTPGSCDHDAVRALLLDHRFGHAQFVDALGQGRDVLLDALFHHALQRFRLQRDDQLQVGAVGGVGERAGPAFWRASTLRAWSRVAASRKRISTRSPTRSMPAWRTFCVAQLAADGGLDALDAGFLRPPWRPPAAGSARRRAGPGRGSSAGRAASASTAACSWPG